MTTKHNAIIFSTWAHKVAHVHTAAFTVLSKMNGDVGMYHAKYSRNKESSYRY